MMSGVLELALQEPLLRAMLRKRLRIQARVLKGLMLESSHSRRPVANMLSCGAQQHASLVDAAPPTKSS